MSIWGVANPFPLPQVIAPTGDVTLTAGSEILVATTTALIAPRGANAYPGAAISLALALAAGAPTAMVIAMRITGGADIATFTVAPAQLVALTTIQVVCWLVGVNSIAQWAGNGSVIEITAKGTTNSSTCKQVGSTCRVGLFMGPDA